MSNTNIHFTDEFKLPDSHRCSFTPEIQVSIANTNDKFVHEVFERWMKFVRKSIDTRKVKVITKDGKVKYYKPRQLKKFVKQGKAEISWGNL